jgi:hypothetical protein
VDRWVGPVRTIASLERPATRAVLDIRGAELILDAGADQPGDLLDSAVVTLGPDVLELTSLRASGGCRPYDVGTYRWTLSGTGTTLELTPITDACSVRAATLAGHWTHTACREAETDCLGELEAGTYLTTDFDPFAEGRYGQLEYRLPDGWANTIDHPTNYFLRPSADYLADPGFDGNDEVHGIYVWAGTAAAAQPDDCAGVEDTSVERSADAIADHWLSLTGLQATELGTMDLGGRTGRMLDLTIDPAWTGTCPWAGGRPFRSLTVNVDLGPDGGVWGTQPGTRQRVVLVDVAPGRVVSIWVDTTSDRFESLAAEAMPIVETMRFVDPSPEP